MKQRTKPYSKRKPYKRKSGGFKHLLKGGSKQGQGGTTQVILPPDFWNKILSYFVKAAR